MFKKLPITQRYTKCNRCTYMGCTWELEQHPIIGHWVWVIKFYYRKLKRIPRNLYLHFTRLDYSKITNIEVDGINTKDYPDFCDAFISYAEYKGKPMNEAQLDRLNSDSSFVYEHIMESIY